MDILFLIRFHLKIEQKKSSEEDFLFFGKNTIYSA